MFLWKLGFEIEPLSREIATRRSSHGGEFGERIDPVKDAADLPSRACPRVLDRAEARRADNVRREMDDEI
jgi:hypothetical protein